MKKQSGFTLIELLVVIALIGILSAIGIPAFTGFQAKARYNAAKTNHATAVSYITAEISKCNDKATAISFINKGGTEVKISACPTTQASAKAYFRLYLIDKFTNPFNTSSLLNIMSASPAPDKGGWGYMGLETNTAGGLTLTTSIGNVDGDTTIPGDARTEQISVSD
jgi:type IV pilus assembly protein PilA